MRRKEGKADRLISPPPSEKLVLVLRDGRKLIGVLRSWDQFGMSLLCFCLFFFDNG